MLFLNLNDESDLNDLAPEGSVTKQVWSNFYRMIIMGGGQLK